MGKMMLDGLAGKAEIRKAESLVVGETCKALTQGAFESPVFPQNLHFCIRSTPTAGFFLMPSLLFIPQTGRQALRDRQHCAKRERERDPHIFQLFRERGRFVSFHQGLIAGGCMDFATWSAGLRGQRRC